MEARCWDYYQRHRNKNIKCNNENTMEKGNYFYFLPKIGENSRRAILIAKVETPDSANYVNQ